MKKYSIASRLEEIGFREIPEGRNISYFSSREYSLQIVKKILMGKITFSVENISLGKENLVLVASGMVIDAPGSLEEKIRGLITEPIENSWPEEATILYRIMLEYLEQCPDAKKAPN